MPDTMDGWATCYPHPLSPPPPHTETHTTYLGVDKGHVGGDDEDDPHEGLDACLVVLHVVPNPAENEGEKDLEHHPEGDGKHVAVGALKGPPGQVVQVAEPAAALVDGHHRQRGQVTAAGLGLELGHARLRVNHGVHGLLLPLGVLLPPVVAPGIGQQLDARPRGLFQRLRPVVHADGVEEEIADVVLRGADKAVGGKVRHRLVGGAKEDGAAFRDEDERVEEVVDGRARLVDDRHHRPPPNLGQALHGAHHAQGLVRIEAARGLVQEQDAGVADELHAN